MTESYGNDGNVKSRLSYV